MREIKFRAWDKIKKRMIYDCGKYNFFMFGENYKEDIEFLQFTGLKDKNGKEIFEGDIVKIFDSDIINIFKWSIFHLGFRLERNGDILDNILPPESEIEVIGNIYENPELLEENKK